LQGFQRGATPFGRSFGEGESLRGETPFYRKKGVSPLICFFKADFSQSLGKNQPCFLKTFFSKNV